MDDIRLHPLVVALLSSTAAVAVVRAVLQIIAKRLPTPRRPADVVADYEKLVDQLQQEVGRLAERVTGLEAHEQALRQQSEEREAAYEAKLQAVRESFRVRIEALYADLERARIRITALEAENRDLQARLEGQVNE